MSNTVDQIDMLTQTLVANVRETLMDSKMVTPEQLVYYDTYCEVLAHSGVFSSVICDFKVPALLQDFGRMLVLDGQERDGQNAVVMTDILSYWNAFVAEVRRPNRDATHAYYASLDSITKELLDSITTRVQVMRNLYLNSILASAARTPGTSPRTQKLVELANALPDCTTFADLVFEFLSFYANRKPAEAAVINRVLALWGQYSQNIKNLD